MCGIYASFSADANKKVFDGLKKIEYRGYDSWGIATLVEQNFSTFSKSSSKDNNNSQKPNFAIKVQKETGKLSDARKFENLVSNLALGHTRWATHGGVTKINAHPHLATNESFALVQNGVVDNYQELKQELEKTGYDFISETDTEVIVGMLEKEMGEAQVLDENSFIKVFNRLLGRNTIACITNDGRIMAIRNGSPLVVGKNSMGEFYFSSDIISLFGLIESYLIIETGQLAIFNSQNGIFSLMDVKTQKSVDVNFKHIKDEESLKNSIQNMNKNDFSSFMLKEIHEQATMLSNVIKDSNKDYLLATKMIKESNKVFTLGSGSASFAAGNTAYLLRKSGIYASTIAAYEADSYQDFFDKNSVGIVFSQSGETADTNEIVEQMKKNKMKIISVVNMPASSLSQMSDLTFMLKVGPEQAVASTKTFSGQVLWGMIISEILSGSKFNDIEIKINEFEHKLSEWFGDILIQRKIKKIAKKLVNTSQLFLLGRGDLYYATLESALKLKEISYMHAEGFSGGELKHGVIALVTKGTSVMCLVAEDENKKNMLNAIAEVKARGGRIIAISKLNNSLYDEWIQIPDTDDFSFISSIIPSQLLTCYIAMENSYDVDKPRNLAKSVTVK